MIYLSLLQPSPKRCDAKKINLGSSRGEGVAKAWSVGSSLETILNVASASFNAFKTDSCVSPVSSNSDSDASSAVQDLSENFTYVEVELEIHNPHNPYRRPQKYSNEKRKRSKNIEGGRTFTGRGRGAIWF